MRFVVVLLLAVAVAPALAYNCTWHGPYNSVFNLFTGTRWGGQGDYHGRGLLYDYRMNLCQPAHTGGPCNEMGYGICAYHHGTTNFVTELGFWAGAQPQWNLIDERDPRHGVRLVFRNGRHCNVSGTFVPRVTTLELPCGPNIHPQEFEVHEDLQHPCHTTIRHPGLANCPVQPPPPPHFPDIPRDFRATVEITVQEHNETYWLHEIHDTRKNRLRNDQYFHPGGWVTHITDFNTHQRYSIINGSQCNVHAISPTERMESVFDILRQHRDRLRFRGIQESRGILCDVWEGRWTFTVDGQQYWEDAVWFFALPLWRVVEDPLLHRRPVSAHLSSNFSRSHLRTRERYTFEFIEFQPHLDHRAQREVDLEWRWNCPGGPPRPSGGANLDGMSSGGVAGLSIFMLALGGAAGVGGLWYYQKRQGGGGYGAISTAGTAQPMVDSTGTAESTPAYQSAADE